MHITFVTSNNEKYKIAQTILKNKGIGIDQFCWDDNEIQSCDICEISRKSALAAFRHLKRTVAVTDVGFYITALKGFPGPFVKYVNYYLDANDIIKLMSHISNREIIVKECLTIIDLHGRIQQYNSSFEGSVAHEAMCCPEGKSSSFEKIFIPKGARYPISLLAEKQRFEFWKTGSSWNFVGKF